MYAVIKAGGRQHKVKPGDVIEVEMTRGTEGAISFHPLLVVDDDGKAHVGKELAKAVVTATAVGDKKGDKVRVFKYKAKSGYARKAGHRPLMTLLEISDVKLAGAGRRSAAKSTAGDAETETAAAE